jgi:hypothetical protein
MPSRHDRPDGPASIAVRWDEPLELAEEIHHPLSQRERWTLSIALVLASAAIAVAERFPKPDSAA